MLLTDIPAQYNCNILLSSSKLKRDSSPNFESLSETDKLLQQKDDEVLQMSCSFSKYLIATI